MLQKMQKKIKKLIKFRIIIKSFNNDGLRSTAEEKL